MPYENEPFIQNVLKNYPEELDTESIVDYYTNKKNIRNGKPIANSSKVNQISVLKKVLKNIKDLPELSKLSLPDEIWKPVKKAQIAQRVANHNDVLRIPNATEFIKKTLEGLNSKLFHELYPALLLASGRRPTEIYMMNIRKGRTPRTIIFKGQLKKRLERGKYEIPLLVDVEVFRKALKNFQRLFPEVKVNNMTPEEIAKAYSKRNADTLLDFSKEYGIKLKASDFRRIYVAESYRRSNNVDGNRSFNSWIMEFLGHYSLDISLNYSNVILDN